MEVPAGTPHTEIIGQDEDSEIRVQPTVQSGFRHLDIRIWRRGPSGVAPSRDAVVLDLPDLEALRQGIDELLEASEGGHQVARIVLDTGDGRRLRAETKPFGTRYVAHLGFWQRARSTWRPDGDGVLLAADRLVPLQAAIRRFRPWVAAVSGGPAQPADAQPSTSWERTADLETWPKPGADWITIEPDRIAFHPKGVRITCLVAEEEDRHRLTLRQWRREDSLWVPEAVSIDLSAVDLDSLLGALRSVRLEDEQAVSEEITLADGSALRLSITTGGRARGPTSDTPTGSAADEGMLCLEHRRETSFELRLVLPAVYLPRFGRMLMQGWSMLIGWLSEAEREQLQGHAAGVESSNEETEEQPLPPVEHRPPERDGSGDPLGVTEEVPVVERPAPRPVAPAVRFGEESETPGAVIAFEREVRIIVEGYLMPRGLTLPLEVVGRVVTGLEEVFAQGYRDGTERRVDPVLLCDRPDCAVYARIGTTMRPDAAELRVWFNPRLSDSITFERIYLPELIEALRQALRATGQSEPFPAASYGGAIERLRREQEAAAAEEVEEPGRQPDPPPPSVHVGDLQIGSHFLRIDLQGPEWHRALALKWDGQTLELPADHLEELLAEVRALYYDALRGRRGQTLTVGEPPVHVTIKNQGTQMHLELCGEWEGRSARLSFPTDEIPAFLDAARSALQ